MTQLEQDVVTEDTSLREARVSADSLKTELDTSRSTWMTEKKAMNKQKVESEQEIQRLKADDTPRYWTKLISTFPQSGAPYFLL